CGARRSSSAWSCSSSDAPRSGTRAGSSAPRAGAATTTARGARPRPRAPTSCSSAPSRPDAPLTRRLISHPGGTAMTTVKSAIPQAAARLGDQLEALSHRIHANPELAYQEVKACGWLCDFLAAQGFKVEKGVAGVDTAFRATLETGAGPTIAILCEYDALP